MAIEFSGTGAQVREAFQTEIHRYQVNGEKHMAAAGDPSVPAALAPVIAGLAPLNDFHPQPHLRVLGRAQFNPKTHQATPQWTYPGSSVQSGLILHSRPRSAHFVACPGAHQQALQMCLHGTECLRADLSAPVILICQAQKFPAGVRRFAHQIAHAMKKL